ncbi:MAG: multicopper oxidase domain-containing protein [Gemmatimonadales bacterium]
MQSNIPMATMIPLVALTLVLSHPQQPSSRPLDDVTANDNSAAAGTMADGTLTVALELRHTVWRPDGPNGVAIPIAAFGEAGKRTSIPGPMIRVNAGTEIRATVRNLLDVRAVVHGLRDHDGTSDSLVLAPGEMRSVTFTASAAGTHAYFARTTVTKSILGRGDDSQLAGAFIVDAPGHVAASAGHRERVFVMTAWDDTVADRRSPYSVREVFAINGLSWPHTERLGYDVGDTIRWRVLNVSQHAHPMHLHGFFFSVQARGTALDDTLYTPAERRHAVTELMTAATTTSLEWVAERPGNWLFHCHSINHIDAALRLEGDSTAMGGSHAHVTDAMSGLVLAISVRDPKATPPSRARAPARNRLRLFITERAGAAGAAPSYGYVLQLGAREPAPDSIVLPGTPIYLHQAESTQITVIDRARHATSVHWHGMELESFYDGVAGWSGADARTAPLLAPGDSFVVRLTPPRAGTFIYHTHADELAQMTGGLYGALIVIPAGATRDTTERLVVLADSAAPDMRATPPSMINGSSAPAPIGMRAGVTHRIRFIAIPAITVKRVRLLDDTVVARWKLLAKDGQDLPASQQAEVSAAARFGAGETMDVAFTSPHAGRFTLEVTSQFSVARVTKVDIVVH